MSSCDAPLRVHVWNGKKYAGEGELVGHRDFVEARVQVYGDETDEERFQRYLVNLEKLEKKVGLKDTEHLKDFERWKKHDLENMPRSTPEILLDTGKTVFGFQCYWTAVEGYDPTVHRYMGIETPPQADEQMEISEYMLQNGKCCACEGTLKGSHLNMVTLQKIATWEYPVWGNIFDKNGMALKYACAIVCDNCVDENTGAVLVPAKYAIDVGGTPRRIVYYTIEDLEDGEPNIELDPGEATALDIFTHLEKTEFRTAVALRGAEEINEAMLKQSAYYLMLINNSYIDSIRDPTDSQHFDLIRQLEVAQSEKPTVIVYDKTVSEEDRVFVEQLLGNLDVREILTHDFTEDDDELAKKVGEILKAFDGEKK